MPVMRMAKPRMKVLERALTIVVATLPMREKTAPKPITISTTVVTMARA